MIWSLLLIAVRHRRLRRPPDPGPELPPVLYSPQVKISAGTQKIFATSGAGRGRAGRAGRDRGAAVHRARIQVPDDYQIIIKIIILFTAHQHLYNR